MKNESNFTIVSAQAKINDNKLEGHYLSINLGMDEQSVDDFAQWYKDNLLKKTTNAQEITPVP